MINDSLLFYLSSSTGFECRDCARISVAKSHILMGLVDVQASVSVVLSLSAL